ncbi:DUF6191 domain-containing protein [Microbispora sp. NPDC046973]|uniref:DUF6191 domain-containing protein n=1 Tax=Microbispora sp. NPDC046973 TaxID=3155022 RepID=UPI0033D61060
MEMLACALILLALLERLWRWAAKVRKSGKSISATGFDEFTAAFLSTKRMQLEQRQSETMLRDDQTDGAPPVNRIDTVGKKITIVLPDKG